MRDRELREWQALVRQRADAEWRELSHDVVDELACHLADLHATALRNGASEKDARRSAFDALIAASFLELSKRPRARHLSGGPVQDIHLAFMQGIWQDVRYGLRRLLKQPTFTGLAVVTLALGVGAATTIFSVIQNVLLDPFPYKDADRVAGVLIQDVSIVRPVGRTAFPLPEFLEYQEHNHVFEEVIGGGHEDVLIPTGEGPEQFDGAFVTPNTFRFLGVPALVGRGLTPEDAAQGAPPV